ncbi:hypothetical protein [Amycolatopsis tucumanensis]|uniref:FHA domain-containing protein n=1 Tax=Amycolatopsis tucumanensis TaxID=401106 RepID=A0ABP7HAL5_9PSEU|nr:hypothetical protein [Amycolatopsis tucumanensis]MCF6425462.1 hypothetical protein [Amycolatopsis tucumanensis]
MYTVTDAFYGDLKADVDQDAGVVELSGPDVPAVEIRRLVPARAHAHVPIGTRQAQQLGVRIDGRRAVITPGPGELRRRTYRVDLTWDQHHYQLKPNSSATSRLVRDGRQLADFSVDGDGDFIVYWLATRDETIAADAAVGYALSLAFGTGAHTMIGMILSGIGALLPG